MIRFKAPAINKTPSDAINRLERTANRRDRQAYNDYMRNYMRKRRQKPA